MCLSVWLSEICVAMPGDFQRVYDSSARIINHFNVEW